LLKWFQFNQRNLPWRKNRDPYRIWISEVMLQQTQVAKVIPYFINFSNKFPDINSLAKGTLHDVLKLWEGLGYYARARNLYQAAALINKNHQGKIPQNYSILIKLPGIGDYIASAVLSQAFKLPYPVVDGNVKRILSRFFLINSPVNLSNSKKIFAKKAEKLLDQNHPGDYNQAMMELGAIICKPQNPLCEKCPITEFCDAFLNNKQNQFPIKAKKKPVPQYHIAVGVIFKEGKVLMIQRRNSGLLGGLWEFPGGKIKKGESATNACIREMKEKVNAEVTQLEFLTEIKHIYSHFKIRMEIFKCNYSSGEIIPKEHQGFRWIRIKKISDFPVHSANLKILPLL